MLSALLMVASFVVRAQIPVEDAASTQFRAFHSHADSIAAFSILAAAAFILFAGPLLYLFRAAEARSNQVRRALIGFCFIGPVLMGGQAIVNWVAVSQVASDFVEQAPGLEEEPFPRLLHQIRADRDSIDKVTLYTDSHSLDVELKDGGLRTSNYLPKQEQTLITRFDDAHVEHEEDSSGSAGDVLAERLGDDSTAVQVGGALQIPALLGFVVGMVYVPMQAMRVGLLTRFVGSLGMALGVSVILLPPAPVMVALWFGYVGLMFLGWTPGGRPPAWDAGEAIPWPRPGEEAPAPPPSATVIQGEATEVPGGNGAAEGSAGAGPGSKRRKRKRRR